MPARDIVPLLELILFDWLEVNNRNLYTITRNLHSIIVYNFLSFEFLESIPSTPKDLLSNGNTARDNRYVNCFF